MAILNGTRARSEPPASIELTDADFENVNPGKERILLPEEGLYPAWLCKREMRDYAIWGHKLVFQWNVFTSPDLRGFVLLERYYNVQRDKANRLIFGPHHSYRQDWIAARNGKLPLDRKKLPPSIFEEKHFLLEIITVRNDSKGRSLSESLYWSRVGRLIRPLEDGERVERCPLQLYDLSS